MPNIPQHIQTPYIPPEPDYDKNARTLFVNYTKGVARWVQTAAQIINAATKTANLTLRTLQPVDESFYVAKDTHQVFTAVDGNWKSVAPRRFRSVVASSAGSLTASFIGGSHASLVPWALPNWSTIPYVSVIDASTVTFLFGTVPGSNAVLYWGVFDEW